MRQLPEMKVYRFLHKIPFAFFFLLWSWPMLAWSDTPALQGLPLQKSVSQYGITWTFAQAVPVAQFVNGDYYVIGPVTVTAITPGYANGRNGSMINPRFDRGTGYDNRVAHFKGSLVAQPPFTLQPGDSLVSTISYTGGPKKHVMTSIYPYYTDDRIHSYIQSAAILTTLASPVPSDTFRPPYTGPRNQLFHARNLHRELLPNLPRPASTPDISFWERVFQRPWIDHHELSWDNRRIHPMDNMPDYGASMSQAASEASLLLMLDFAPAVKEPLLISFIQWGLDVYGMAREAALQRHDFDPTQPKGWEAMGGHGNGRKWPMLFAGLMFQNTSILNTRALFSEDQQTYHGQGWNGATALYRHFHRDMLPKLWNYETLQPKNWPDPIGENYRRGSTSAAWYGQALLAYKMNAMKAWNHPAWFDYVDRWMNDDDDADRAEMKRQLGNTYNTAEWDFFTQKDGKGTTLLSKFGMDMWSMYRFDTPPSPPHVQLVQ